MKKPQPKSHNLTKHQARIVARLIAGETLVAPLTVHSIDGVLKSCGLGMYRFHSNEKAVNIDTVISMKHKGVVISVDDLQKAKRYVRLRAEPANLNAGDSSD